MATDNPQFEEVFTQAGDEAKPFQQIVLGLSQLPYVYVVLVVRSDFCDNLLNSSLWPKMQAQPLHVLRLDRDGLRQAIACPAEHVGVEVELELTERLLADASGGAFDGSSSDLLGPARTCGTTAATGQIC